MNFSDGARVQIMIDEYGKLCFKQITFEKVGNKIEQHTADIIVPKKTITVIMQCMKAFFTSFISIARELGSKVNLIKMLGFNPNTDLTFAINICHFLAVDDIINRNEELNSDDLFCVSNLFFHKATSLKVITHMMYRAERVIMKLKDWKNVHNISSYN